ncbi:hypothetical protein RAS1_12840 [Phycisphaerae bacterium RAS1]|nr:hypothetical protein RAS1_12840 [Phycisphaerae bacterium RAS1]
MPRDKTTAGTRGSRGRTEILFTPATANRALAYIRPIVEDLVAGHSALMAARGERDALLAAESGEEAVTVVHRRIDALVDRLNRLHEELTDVGCVLKDWSGGLVDFPALHQGRKVWLCWRRGEPAVSHWHELHLGFANREKLGADFETA